MAGLSEPSDSLGTLSSLNGFLVLQVPDLDARAGSGAKPVPVRAEDQSADLFAAVQLVEGVVAVLAEVPEEGFAVLATGGSQGTIGGDGDGVDESGVALEVVLELEVAEVPDLDDLVPTAGDDHGVVGGGGESDGRDPFLVAVFALLSPLGLSEGVPELQGLVPRGGDDLPVVSREGDGEDVVLVADEPGGSDALFKVPKPEGLVPRSGDGKLSARADHDVADKVGVASEPLHGGAVAGLVVLV